MFELLHSGAKINRTKFIRENVNRIDILKFKIISDYIIFGINAIAYSETTEERRIEIINRLLARVDLEKSELKDEVSLCTSSKKDAAACIRGRMLSSLSIKSSKRYLSDIDNESDGGYSDPFISCIE